ncbi:MAG TPA: hypothetical protein DCS07_13835 [Bdellovibrionales bacterium]|nr:MAG: hypothetical protein A2Z97_12070 [Bdellovibrionales bacterium GWB1_52_6]OFZ06032.1 MAG: hypothetical protein A2X97_01705 [Bdellovibrionales bacterium GWA1_52_35]OFZ41037.1 MAG: hypothetical protein A2070_03185 [Bdellovibrionales bacterium GWC1_52_8]HAR43690.1 hypothetical protein [Bdellovibrionales bacterium]HCM39344.1 hypothetical protein [Bdellovibrionales bacterium]
MTLERRKPDHLKSSLLPKDYLKMVRDVFTANFDPGLKALTKLTSSKATFTASGEIFSTEVVLAVSLTQSHHLAASTVYASADFDPKASSPTVEEILSACVDAIASVFGDLLDPETPKRLLQVADESLSALEGIPYDWTSFVVNKRTIYLKMDKANPNLDRMADDWLAKHDPTFQEMLEEEQEETEKLFITGKSSKNSTKH